MKKRKVKMVRNMKKYEIFVEEENGGIKSGEFDNYADAINFAYSLENDGVCIADVFILDENGNGVEW